MRSLLAPATIALSLCSAVPARANDAIIVALGAGGAKTEWAGDAAANTSFKLGYAVNESLLFYGMTRVGYGLSTFGTTNLPGRAYEFFSFGAQLSTTIAGGDARPYVRGAACHQHEETVDLLKASPFSALAGVANGLHHRTGFEGGVGIEFALLRSGQSEIFASIEGTNIWFFDSNGPHFYWGGGAALGFNYEL